MRRVRVQPEEVGRALHDLQLFGCELGEAVPENLLDARRVVAFVDWILGGHRSVSGVAERCAGRRTAKRPAS